MLEAEARERQAHGQTAPGKTLPVKLPEASESRDQAGKQMGGGGNGPCTAPGATRGLPEGSGGRGRCGRFSRGSHFVNRVKDTLAPARGGE